MLILNKKLKELQKSNQYPFHMPGHKRRLDGDFYGIDITEIEGFDNLHYAEGVLKESMDFATELYGSKRTFYLVGGSTLGIQTAISACVPRGGKIILARNSHKAAYNGAYLRNLKVEYAYPTIAKNGLQGQITIEEISKVMDENPDSKAVFITSPTYDGIVSDVEGIAKEVHKRDKLLIVDAAHGAHFGFHKSFPESPVKQGADLVIMSTHKTLPAPTQTALLHICSDRIDEKDIEKYLDIFETSSPSYVLMSGIEKSLHIVSEEKEALFSKLSKNLNSFYEKAKGLKKLYVVQKEDYSKEEAFDADISKIMISTAKTNLSGEELLKILLEKYELSMEMSAGCYVTALTSIMDEKAAFDRLYLALEEIDRIVALKEEAGNESSSIYEKIPQKKFEMFEALDMPYKELDIESAVGKASGEMLYLYPPGIPLVVPGEIITEEVKDLFLGQVIRTLL